MENTSIQLQDLGKFKKFFKDEELKFRIRTSLQLAGISIFSIVLLILFLWTFLKFDRFFFASFDVLGVTSFEGTFYEFIVGRLLNYFWWVIGFIFLVTLSGLYISNMILRPFRTIGDYCLAVVEGKKISYDPDFFSELKLLTRFSEYFFTVINTMIKKDESISKMDIPEKYSKIHQPVFENGFFIQYSFFIIITTICSGIAIYAIGVELHSQLVLFAKETLELNSKMTMFLESQKEILKDILYIVLVLHVLLSAAFCYYLYHKVAAPAFGVFATFRSFLKGNYSARVHLLGFYYLRPECRKINKYLDFLQKSYILNNKND